MEQEHFVAFGGSQAETSVCVVDGSGDQPGHVQSGF